MSFEPFKNCFFEPATKDTPGLLYLLSDDPVEYTINSFVIIPYTNSTSKIDPCFYRLEGVIRTDVSPLMQYTDVEYPIRMKSRTPKEEYIKNIHKLKEEIQNGNIYEINYCIEFYAENILIDPLNIFLKLNELAKAPYSQLIKLGDEYIICASPELFLAKKGNTVYTKPIKGTIKRGKNKEEDLELKNELQNNLKERTENVMAVDVARNDLSMFAKKGSVSVNKLYNIETFETVHQMVSTVSCEAKENTSFKKIIDSTFPMASMTGAPKHKAMELINSHEDFERNYYSGTMGTIDEKGDLTLSVIIRSIFYNQKTKKISIAVGGAITYLSDPEKEYQECLLKASALLKVLNAEIN
ncbi:chorismate-binding protein [Aurantibacillus circumpalustris]|uniref:chorismate-binding protein n=1 Tax=Aurantibacillus circumpalustris TaxID=3036359 RepID=UPI00295A6EE4|nr:anthranilate synthase component I family protein [Aurantibacillus circumpalustris]